VLRSLEVAEELTVEIDRLAYGVFGVARTDRGVVLVPGVAPGDVARVRVVETKRGHREAELIELVREGAARRTPPCPHLPECGGCAWQHVERPAQLAAKRQILIDTLARVGGFDAERLDVRPILWSSEWAYRHRITLRVDGEQRLGFYRHRSHQLVEISACRIADDAVNAHLATARDWLRGVSTTIRRVEIASTGPVEDRRVVFVANAEGPFRHDGEYHERFLRRQPRVVGIVIHGKGWRRTFGRPLVTLEIDGGRKVETEGGFTQVNAEQNRQLVDTVVELAAPRADDRVLDLFCGAGNLTLPLARRAAVVVGVESDAASIASARRNADRWRLGNCRFIQQEASAAARGLAEGGERFPLLVLDPPRSGASELLDDVTRLATERVVYVSCNPATLARDLARIVASGFKLGAIQPIDLFPQTYHLETVVRLDKGP
jgi:23S rRNA (uracil1939-C5)-methyltransferase